jgi:hypothetical protein
MATTHKPKYTKGRHGGFLWIIKKDGKEYAYAETEAMAERKIKKLREGKEL